MWTGMGDNFTLGLLVGGFLLASWVDSRVGDSRPGATKRRMCHAFAGVIVLQVSVGALYLVHAAASSQALMLVAIFAIFLPALVYAVLGGLWVLRTLAELRVAR